MTGYLSFLRKELHEIVRTWRLWVLPGIMLFFAISGPLAAKYMPELLRSMLGDQANRLPPLPVPTYLDSWAQWLKNIGQLGLFAVMLLYGGMISAERKSGTAVLVLTKPVGRWAFLLAKLTAATILIGGATALGTLVTGGLTAVMFADVDVAPLLKGTGFWLIQVGLYLAVLALLSAWMKSSVAASAAGIGVLFAVSTLGLWGPASRRSPAGIGDIVSKFMTGEHPAWIWPTVTTLVASTALVLLAGLVFRRCEL